MAQEFYFEYEPVDKFAYEAKPVGGGFAALMNCNEEILQQWNLWPSFVAEFRADWQSFEESALSGNGDEEEDDDEYEDFEELLDEDSEISEGWGPSSPFAPQVAKEWAHIWIQVLEKMTDEQAQQVFLFFPQLHQTDSPFGRKHEISELQKLIKQAECAENYNVMMTMHMVWG